MTTVGYLDNHHQVNIMSAPAGSFAVQGLLGLATVLAYTASGVLLVACSCDRHRWFLAGAETSTSICWLCVLHVAQLVGLCGLGFSVAYSAHGCQTCLSTHTEVFQRGFQLDRPNPVWCCIV